MRGFTNRTGTQYKYYDNKIYIFHIKIIYSVWCFHHTLRLIINLQRSFLWVNNNFNSLFVRPIFYPIMRIMIISINRICLIGSWFVFPMVY